MNFKILNEALKKYICEENEKPFKFTIDYDDGRPEDIIEYGVDEEDAKANLLKTHKYLQGKEERITNIEPVKEDHEEVTLPFTMIHRSSEGPDASGEVTFFPTAFGYEYQCTEKDFNGRGPQWSTIRTIEGIKIWFRNVLFEFGAKTVTIGDETWDIDDFPKEDVNEGRSTQGHRQEILKEIDYDELAKKLIAKEGKEKLEKGIKKNNTKEYFYSLVGKDENIDPAALADAIERQLDSNSIDEDYVVTNADRCNMIDEDRHDLLQVIEKVCNKYNDKSVNWDDEKQQNFANRIMEIMENAEVNLRNVSMRMG